MADFCGSPNNQLALELSKNRGWRTRVCFPFSGLAHAQATLKNLKTITVGQKCRLYIRGLGPTERGSNAEEDWGRYYGWDLVQEGCKLRQTLLPPHASLLRSAYPLTVVDVFGFSGTKILAKWCHSGGLSSVWSYRHGWLTRRLQRASQQIDRPAERPVPLYCLSHTHPLNMYQEWFRCSDDLEWATDWCLKH